MITPTVPGNGVGQRTSAPSLICHPVLRSRIKFIEQPLTAAKRRGRRGGRPPVLGPEQLEQVIAALDGGASKASVCRSFKVARSTLLDTLARVGWSGPAVVTSTLKVAGIKLAPSRKRGARKTA